MQIYTNMKIRIKLDLYVLKEYFIANLCEKKMLVGWFLRWRKSKDIQF